MKFDKDELQLKPGTEVSLIKWYDKNGDCVLRIWVEDGQTILEVNGERRSIPYTLVRNDIVKGRGIHLGGF